MRKVRRYEHCVVLDEVTKGFIYIYLFIFLFMFYLFIYAFLYWESSEVHLGSQQQK